MDELQVDSEIRKSLLQDLVGKNLASGGLRLSRGELARRIDDELISRRILFSLQEEENFKKRMLSEIVGLGPIEGLVHDPEISEVMVNGPHEVYIERKGRIEKTNIAFEDSVHLLRVIERIIFPLGLRLDHASPMVDAVTEDGSRINAVIQPICRKGPVLTIRKFPQTAFSVADFLASGTFDQESCALIKETIRERKNILVFGGASSGKTTLLNVLSELIPEGERVICIEDTPELKLKVKHCIYLHGRPSNVEGRGEVALRDLLRNALRMRPDRLIVGEIRGPECIDFLQALNTGHDGCFCTVHASSPKEVVYRLETLALMSGLSLPVRALRQQIAAGINVLVMMKRDESGKRFISRITRVEGIRGSEVGFADIYVKKKDRS